VYLVALVAVPFGLTLSSVMPGDLEAFLTMIGVVGVQLALPYASSAGPAGPLYGPKQVLYAANRTTISLSGPVAHSLIWTAVLLIIAAYATHRRARIQTN
jgi:hypothetical protein